MPKDKLPESPYYFDKLLIDTELQELLEKNPPIDVHTKLWGDRLKKKRKMIRNQLKRKTF